MFATRKFHHDQLNSKILSVFFHAKKKRRTLTSKTEPPNMPKKGLGKVWSYSSSDDVSGICFVVNSCKLLL